MPDLMELFEARLRLERERDAEVFAAAALEAVVVKRQRQLGEARDRITALNRAIDAAWLREQTARFGHGGI